MKVEHIYDQFRGKVQPALESKASEFRVLGYETITPDEIWTYLIEKKWRRLKENIHLYEVVADILALKVGDYMNYATVEAFREADIFSISEEERKALFGEDSSSS